MPSDIPSATDCGPRRSRRTALVALGAAASVSLAGCGGVLSGSGSESGDGPGEVSVENRTESAAEIAVRVVGRGDETLFGDVFALGPERLTSRGAIEATPARVHAFTADGASRTWRYDPDLPPEFDCDPKDVGLTLRPGGVIEPWYSC